MNKLFETVLFILKTDLVKSIRLSFFYFPFKDAIKLPIMVSYRTRLKMVGGGVKVYCKIRTGMFLFGYCGLGTQDSFYERSIWEVDGLINIKGTKVRMGRGTKLCVGGDCSFGDNFTVTGRSTIFCNHNIVFGENVLVSWDVLIMDTDGGHRILDSKSLVINDDRSIEIGNHVWIGCRSTILKGTRIPDNSVIAAGAITTTVMTKNGCIYASGGKILKENINWIH